MISFLRTFAKSYHLSNYRMSLNSTIHCIYRNSSVFLGLTILFSGAIAQTSLAADKSALKTSQTYLSSASDRQLIASSDSVLPATVNLVKEFEGFSANTYIDTSGLPVIGYGQTKINGATVSMGQYITQAQADLALEQELYHIQKLVKSHIRVELNPYQLGALTSLVYNAGTRVLTNSTLARKLNAGDYAGAAREFPRWNKANQGGRLVAFPGLTKRRLAEQKLFLTPVRQIASN